MIPQECGHPVSPGPDTPRHIPARAARPPRPVPHDEGDLGRRTAAAPHQEDRTWIARTARPPRSRTRRRGPPELRARSP
ncbi:MAG: hypothetical protein LBE67_11925 [Kocuria palustris]|nr:hypothetical protein [Kocuria palustris]